MVSVLAEAARSECAPSMRAMETTPAASLNAGGAVLIPDNRNFAPLTNINILGN